MGKSRFHSVISAFLIVITVHSGVLYGLYHLRYHLPNREKSEESAAVRVHNIPSMPLDQLQGWHWPHALKSHQPHSIVLSDTESPFTRRHKEKKGTLLHKTPWSLLPSLTASKVTLPVLPKISQSKVIEQTFVKKQHPKIAFDRIDTKTPTFPKNIALKKTTAWQWAHPPVGLHPIAEEGYFWCSAFAPKVADTKRSIDFIFTSSDRETWQKLHKKFYAVFQRLHKEQIPFNIYCVSTKVYCLGKQQKLYQWDAIEQFFQETANQPPASVALFPLLQKMQQSAHSVVSIWGELTWLRSTHDWQQLARLIQKISLKQPWQWVPTSLKKPVAYHLLAAVTKTFPYYYNQADAIAQSLCNYSAAKAPSYSCVIGSPHLQQPTLAFAARLPSFGGRESLIWGWSKDRGMIYTAKVSENLQREVQRIYPTSVGDAQNVCQWIVLDRALLHWYQFIQSHDFSSLQKAMAIAQQFDQQWYATDSMG